MAIEIVMPRLGWTMETGVLVEWLKKDGDTVQPGDVLFTVESDKALNEVESFDAGRLYIPSGAPALGSTIPVGGLLAYLLKPGESAPSLASVNVEPQSASAQVPVAPASHSQNGKTSPINNPKISPRARRIAAELRIPWADLNGSGRSGRIVERDIRAAMATLTLPPVVAPIRASPLAKRVAEDLGVDLGHLAGQIADRRIERADVESAARKAESPPTPVPPIDGNAQPIPPIRRLIAERMTHSAHTAAPVTLTSEVDATELVRLRNQIKRDSGSAGRPVPSYTDLLVKLCAEALREHPALNARLDGDSIWTPAGVHIGIAVDTERGLLVPVVREVQSRTIRQITQESSALIEAARTGKLEAAAMRGGTFTITNLGMYGIDAFTPIINLPECAILGVGRIVPKQVVIDAEAEQVAIRHMMFLSLTFDHRLVDGGGAARFLQRVTAFIAQPYLWLI